MIRCGGWLALGLRATAAAAPQPLLPPPPSLLLLLQAIRYHHHHHHSNNLAAVPNALAALSAAAVASPAPAPSPARARAPAPATIRQTDAQRLLIIRTHTSSSSSSSSADSTPPSPPSSSSSSSSSTEPSSGGSTSSSTTTTTTTTTTTPVGKIEPRYLIGFTCNVCKTRSNKLMSKRAYETGVVIVQCDGCKSRHLIADHLGWFDTTQGKIGTIEDIMKRKAEEEANAAQQVVRVRNIGEMGLSQAEMDELGIAEWVPKEQPSSSSSSSSQGTKQDRE